jgi:hypothetical protein
VVVAGCCANDQREIVVVRQLASFAEPVVFATAAACVTWPSGRTWKAILMSPWRPSAAERASL